MLQTWFLWYFCTSKQFRALKIWILGDSVVDCNFPMVKIHNVFKVELYVCLPSKNLILGRCGHFAFHGCANCCDYWIRRCIFINIKLKPGSFMHKSWYGRVKTVHWKLFDVFKPLRSHQIYLAVDSWAVTGWSRWFWPLRLVYFLDVNCYFAHYHVKRAYCHSECFFGKYWQRQSWIFLQRKSQSN